MTAAAGASGAALGPAASLAVKVLEVLLPEDAAAKAARRIFQREIFLLADVTQEAAELATMSTQIERVWGREMDKQTHKTLNWIASLNADPLLTVAPA